jgi:hypothetical protein
VSTPIWAAWPAPGTPLHKQDVAAMVAMLRTYFAVELDLDPSDDAVRSMAEATLPWMREWTARPPQELAEERDMPPG